MGNGSSTLSEFASKRLLASYGIPVSRERLAEGAAAAESAAMEIGLPVALKLCGDGIAHKTERDLVRLGLASGEAVREAARDLLARRRPEDGKVELLVAEMVEGRRELIAGMVRDPQFGPCVLLGLGGILTEALADVAFAAAPLTRTEARAMIHRLAASHLITKPFRGEPAADEEALVAILVGLGRLAIERAEVASVDLNPVILRGAEPVAVDALVEIAEVATEPRPVTTPRSDEEVIERFRPLFEPRGIVLAGVSSHPGKFGFTAYHNLLRFGYRGELFPVNRDGLEILGRPTLRDVSEVPEGRADLVFVCTPAVATARPASRGRSWSGSWSKWPIGSACWSPVPTVRE
jgi:hypothetical protein